MLDKSSQEAQKKQTMRARESERVTVFLFVARRWQWCLNDLVKLWEGGAALILKVVWAKLVPRNTLWKAGAFTCVGAHHLAEIPDGECLPAILEIFLRSASKLSKQHDSP